MSKGVILNLKNLIMRKYIFLLCYSFISFALNAQVDLDLGLKAYYNFDENALDQSENTNHGALQGAPVYLFGVNEECISFNQVDDYVAINNDLQLGNTFTITAWVRTNSIDKEWQTVIAKYESNHYGPYWIGLHYDKVNTWISDGNGSHCRNQ